MKCFILVGESSGEIQKELDMAKKLFSSTGAELEVETVCIDDIMVISQHDFKGKLWIAGKEVNCPDFVLVGVMGVSRQYQFKAVLRMFESLGVLCINPAETVERTNDKLYTFQVAMKEVPEIRIPKTVLITSRLSAAEIGAQVGYPVVVKVMHGSMGKGIMLAQTQKELENLLCLLFAADFDDEVIAQQAILSSRGKDIRLILVGGEVVHSFVRCNDGHFKSNVKQGGYLVDFEAPEELKRMSEKLAKALDLKMGSIDYLFGEKEGEFYLCEANSMPGITYIFEAQQKGDRELLKKIMEVPQKLLAQHGNPKWKQNPKGE